MGETVFRKIQYGLEATRGTAVAATKLFPGTISVPADRKPQYPEETTGIRVKSLRQAVYQIHVDPINVVMEHGIFQYLPILFQCGLKGTITPTEQTGGQGDYLWDFSHSLTAANEPKSSTWEYGNDQQAYETEYVMFKRYVISGAIGEDQPVKVEAEGFGKQRSNTSFTSSLTTHSTLQPMIANMTKIYIDSSWAGLGGTVKSDILREFSVEILTGIHPVFAASGVKTMTGYGEGFLDCMINLVVENNTNGDALYDDFLAGTSRAIRLLIEGSQIGSGTNHSLTIDAFGSFEEAVPMSSEKDGNDLTSLLFHTHSDNLATPHHFAVKVVTDKNTV